MTFVLSNHDKSIISSYSGYSLRSISIDDNFSIEIMVGSTNCPAKKIIRFDELSIVHNNYTIAKLQLAYPEEYKNNESEIVKEIKTTVISYRVFLEKYLDYKDISKVDPVIIEEHYAFGKTFFNQIILFFINQEPNIVRKLFASMIKHSYKSGFIDGKKELQSSIKKLLDL